MTHTQPAELAKILNTRVKRMGLVSVGLMALISTLALGYVSAVIAFETVVAPQTDVATSLRDSSWDAQRTIVASSRVIEDTVNSKNLDPEIVNKIVRAQLLAVQREVASLSNATNELAEAVSRKKATINAEFLNGRRVLFAIGAIFVVLVLRLLIELYKYNAHLRSHYMALMDALILEGERFNQVSFDKSFRLLAPTGIQIGSVRDVVAELAVRSPLSGNG